MNNDDKTNKGLLTDAQTGMLKSVSTTNSSGLQGSQSSSSAIVINYQPHAASQKWLEHRMSDWNSTKSLFAYATVFLFFSLGGPDHLTRFITYLSHLNILGAGLQTATGADAAAQAAALAANTASQTTVLEILFGSFGLSAIGVYGGYLATPTHFRMDYDGIELQWNHSNLPYKRALTWEQMEHIEMFYPKGKTSPQDCIVRFLAKDSAKSLQLKLAAFASVNDRSRLYEGINRWAGNLSRDPHLIEVLTPAQDHSYTELWLQALSAPPKRERLTPISSGALLGDNRFRIDSQLGVGGQGTAYLANTVKDQSEVVLKEFILPVYVDINVRRQALERMQNEAAMLRRLDNPRIVRLLDFFVEDHRGYLVLERIDGHSLRHIVQEEGRMPENRVRELALQMCEMLKYLHDLTPPVVHRDFTPDNLILGKDGILKLVDFNVAQQTESTATGTVVGKHCYLPPEQFRGKPTPQSDIYALGATLYFLLIGSDPEAITSSNPILKNDKISRELNEIVAKATELDLKKRFASAAQIETELNL